MSSLKLEGDANWGLPVCLLFLIQTVRMLGNECRNNFKFLNHCSAVADGLDLMKYSEIQRTIIKCDGNLNSCHGDCLIFFFVMGLKLCSRIVATKGSREFYMGLMEYLGCFFLFSLR